MINLDEQLSLFKLIGNKLKRKIEVFVIGGSLLFGLALLQVEPFSVVQPGICVLLYRLLYP